MLATRTRSKQVEAPSASPSKTKDTIKPVETCDSDGRSRSRRSRRPCVPSEVLHDRVSFHARRDSVVEDLEEVFVEKLPAKQQLKEEPVAMPESVEVEAAATATAAPNTNQTSPQMVKETITDKPTARTTTQTRKRRSSASREVEATASHSRRKKKEAVDEDDDQSWICAECREAECLIEYTDDFLICDGPCRRVFHRPCAGLQTLPSTDEDWLCKDCTKGSHACAICQGYGDDGEDVFRCSEQKCGLFFHESCLSLTNVEVQVVYPQVQVTSEILSPKSLNLGVSKVVKGSDDSTSAIEADPPMMDQNILATERNNEGIDQGANRGSIRDAITPSPPPPQQQPSRVFTCPAHNCWTCTQAANEYEGYLNTDRDELHEEENSKRQKKATGKQKKAKAAEGRAIKACFQKKPGNQRLYRCMVCPTAFHLTCIPPSSKFHELALLCSEHSQTYKLPDLDIAHSYQNEVEEKVTLMFNKHNRKAMRSGARKRGSSKLYGDGNPFFRNMRADRLAFSEQRILESVHKVEQRQKIQNMQQGNDASDENGGDQEEKSEGADAKPGANNFELGFENFHTKDHFNFCMPCEMKQEVHGKPPSYKHINGLRYDPENRPKRLLGGAGCHCMEDCGEDCFNRATFVECYGEANETNSNCGVGSAKCTNRSLTRRKFIKCKPSREEGKGWGLIPVDKIRRGQLIMEYVGEVINEDMKEKRLKEWAVEHPNDPNFYIMALQGSWYVDARHEANLTRFINHSCDPNCKVIAINVRGYKRCGIFALRDIKQGEFLSYDYHFDTNEGDRFICRCGAAKCRGTMKGGGGDVGKKPRTWKEAKARYDADKKYLEDVEAGQISSNVDYFVPSAESETHVVSSGPNPSFRDSAVTNKIFLWRNVLIGADLTARAERMGRKGNR